MSARQQFLRSVNDVTSLFYKEQIIDKYLGNIDYTLALYEKAFESVFCLNQFAHLYTSNLLLVHLTFAILRTEDLICSVKLLPRKYHLRIVNSIKTFVNKEGHRGQ